MRYVNPQELYINSFLRFAKTKEFVIRGEKTGIQIYLLDKRFLTTLSINNLKITFPYCKLKDLDKYWIAVYSSYSLNKYHIFAAMMNQNLIISLSDFIKMTGV